MDIYSNMLPISPPTLVDVWVLSEVGTLPVPDGISSAHLPYLSYACGRVRSVEGDHSETAGDVPPAGHVAHDGRVQVFVPGW